MKKKKWFGVKLIFVNKVQGKPDAKLIDEKYKKDYVAYEERVVIVKANSFNKAYKKAIKKAKEEKDEYKNIYGQKVIFSYFNAIDCFEIYDKKIKNGSEVYSCFYESNQKVSEGDFVEKTFPVDFEPNYMLMNTELNKQ